MKKTSRLTQISLLLAVFFGVDKLMGVLRTIIIGRQFGLSEELDVFNAANNLPDLLFALISGGALAIAFIPVLSATLSKEGREAAWRLFSQVANLAFLVTGGLAIVIALLAGPLVRGQLGIAPGFSPEQQDLAIQLMRMNLISTLIFSISGLVMAGLQANQHFLLPAIAPLVYDLGQIFGAVILAPEEGLVLGGVQLPAFGLGIQGLVYGVIIGAALHLLIQVPGLIKYRFHWTPRINFKDDHMKEVLRLMGPRLVSMVFIQLIFLARDNLASRLVTGSVTALSYGWWIQQVPETLMGTAIATALLPTLANLAAEDEQQAFKDTIERSLRVMIALSLPITADYLAGEPAADPGSLWFLTGRRADDPLGYPGVYDWPAGPQHRGSGRQVVLCQTKCRCADDSVLRRPGGLYRTRHWADGAAGRWGHCPGKFTFV